MNLNVTRDGFTVTIVSFWVDFIMQIDVSRAIISVFLKHITLNCTLVVKNMSWSEVKVHIEMFSQLLNGINSILNQTVRMLSKYFDP